jgi:hypothetical protein
MNMYLGVEVYLHEFLTSVIDGGEWPASLPGRFTSGENCSWYHWTGGWVGTMDAVAKRKISLPLLEIELRPSSP